MRQTRWAMVAIGIALTLFAIVWPGMQVSIVVLASALVRVRGVRTADRVERVRIPVLIIAAVVAAVVLWLLVGVVFEPLDSAPGP